MCGYQSDILIAVSRSNEARPGGLPLLSAARRLISEMMTALSTTSLYPSKLWQNCPVLHPETRTAGYYDGLA
jgi:hypothetical protein